MGTRRRVNIYIYINIIEDINVCDQNSNKVLEYFLKARRMNYVHDKSCINNKKTDTNDKYPIPTQFPIDHNG